MSLEGQEMGSRFRYRIEQGVQRGAFGIQTEQLTAFLREHRGADVTLIVVTHELASIYAIADRVVMLDGRVKKIVAEGSPAQLLGVESGDGRFRHGTADGERLDDRLVDVDALRHGHVSQRPRQVAVGDLGHPLGNRGAHFAC